MSRGPEAKIEDKSRKAAIAAGCLCYKFTSPSNRSVPDRLFITPTGRTFYVEFKAPGKKPTPLQALTIDKMRKHNASVYVCDNYEQFLGILDIELFS